MVGVGLGLDQLRGWRLGLAIVGSIQKNVWVRDVEYTIVETEDVLLVIKRMNLLIQSTVGASQRIIQTQRRCQDTRETNQLCHLHSQQNILCTIDRLIYPKIFIYHNHLYQHQKHHSVFLKSITVISFTSVSNPDSSKPKPNSYTLSPFPITSHQSPLLLFFFPLPSLPSPTLLPTSSSRDATFFLQTYNKNFLMIHFQSDTLYRDCLGISQSKFHNYQTSTNVYLPSDITNHSPVKSFEETAEHTLAELPKSTQTIQDGQPAFRFQQEIEKITERFGKIQQIFIGYSQRESRIHERLCDLKEMRVDWRTVSNDFTNKITIVEDLRHLADVAEKGSNGEVKDLIASKFQEYYLERHYGGLQEVHDLSIQEKGEEREEEAPREECSVGKLQCVSGFNSESSLEYINLKAERETSRIGGFIGLGNESKISYNQSSSCQKREEYSISVQVPRIIEIQIPLIVYRVKEKIITYDESDLDAPYKDIDEIIDKYSRPYDDLYACSGKPAEDYLTFEDFSNPQPNQIQQIGSIMLNSNVLDLKEMTEVELTYSHIPDQQLLMDSFAQIGSLISNDREERVGTICITEKLNSKSILEKFEESERILNEENLELKETVTQLRAQLEESEKKKQKLTATNNKLAHRLQEEIQQGVYLSKKLDELDAELLQEKVGCLTRLAECKERKIEQLTQQLAQKQMELDMAKNELQQLRIIGDKTQELLVKRQEELMHLTKQLQEKDLELDEINNSGEYMIRVVSQTELSLKGEIQKLELEKTQMKEKLNEYQKRVENDGINLQYEEAQEIQGIIESREHIHRVEIEEIKAKYQLTLQACREEIEELKEEIRVLHELSQAKSEVTCTTIKEKKVSQSYINEFQALIEEYDRQLEAKDQQILQLKEKYHSQRKIEVNSHEDFQQFINKSAEIIKGLSDELQRQRVERMKLTARLIEVDQMVNKSGKVFKEDAEYKLQQLVQQLTAKIEKMQQENIKLQAQLQTHNTLQAQAQTNHQLSSLQSQILRLKKVNSKLKKYTTQIQSDLLSISGMSRCESHTKIINSLIQERDYYVGLLTN